MGSEMCIRDREITGKPPCEKLSEFPIETVACVCVEGRDAGGRPNAPAPSIGRVAAGDVETEGFESEEARLSHLSRPLRVHAVSAAEFPCGVVEADQCLGRFDEIAVERNPIEMADHQSP